MKFNYFIIGILILVISISACTPIQTTIEDTSNGDTSSNDNAKSGSSEAKVIQSGNTPYLEFSQVEYDKALGENKVILLKFHATWCPICEAETPKTKAALNEINDVNVIGFQVNYRDSSTDEFETELARKHGVSYQNSKIIIVNGERVLKTTEAWEKDKYLEELNKYI